MSSKNKPGPTGDFNHKGHRAPDLQTTAEYSIAPGCIQELTPALLMAGATPHAVAQLTDMAGALSEPSKADLRSLKAAEHKLGGDVHAACKTQLRETVKFHSTPPQRIP